MRQFYEKKQSDDMFESLGNAIKQEQEKREKKRQWIIQLLDKLEGTSFLQAPFKDKTLVHKMPKSISKMTQIAGVDGGIISESMTGFDLALYRAVSAVFHGIGEKVESSYIPHFDPDPQVFFSPSLKSRHEFNHICTLLRLYVEYEVAKMTIEQTNATVIFLDGKVTPLRSDFSITDQSKLLKQAEDDVKKIYNDLVELAFDENVLLCGLVKDSRSREYAGNFGLLLPKIMDSHALEKSFIRLWPYMLEDIQDTFFSEIVLEKGERTAWLQSSIPNWVSSVPGKQLWTCLAKPVVNDEPVRLEVLFNPDDEDFRNALDIALGALNILCNHGLDLAIPTVILEADERTKLSAAHLDTVIDQISLSLGIPRENLRKRRYYTSSLNRL